MTTQTGSKATAERRIQKAVMSLLHCPHYKPLAGILMIGSRQVVESIKETTGNKEAPETAYTDGKDETYSRGYVDKCTDAQLRGLIVHENKHKMYRHLITWQSLYRKSAEKANIACDMVIDGETLEENPDGFVDVFGPEVPDEVRPRATEILKSFRGLNAKQVFDKLPPGKPKGGSGGSGGYDGAGDGHGWEKATSMDHAERAKLSQDIDRAIRQGQLLAGNGKADGDRRFEDLLKATVDWREALRDFITSMCSGSDFSTWQRPNRRFLSAGVYMPTGVSQTVDEVLIAVDTSGSISDDQLGRFLGEVVSMLATVKPSSVRLLYWGTEVVRDEKYDEQDLMQGNLANSTKPAHGGGTDPSCIPAYMRQEGLNPQVAIVLTDGIVPGWGQWSVPVMFCVLDNAGSTSPVGKTIHIDGEEL